MMKQKLLYLVRFGFFLCLMFGINSAFAQEGSVSGQISDNADGSLLPGVSILIKGTTTGTITDMDGKFTLKIKEKVTLVVSFIGYDAKEVEANPGDNLTVKLSAKSTDIAEVLVIGYGTVKKSDATGSVASVSSKDFNKGAITSPQDLLVGKSAGVVITSAGGAPGAGSTIRIRGGSSLSASNDPLIVIDGMPVDNGGISGMSNPLSVINPNDIETFTVLKDASATAIYGSRASNGVIIITTKKGKAGKGMKITYDGNISVSSPIKYVDVYSGDEFRQLAYAHKDMYGADALTQLGTANTDWQKEIFRTAISSDHNISLAGVVSKIPYRASVGYTNQSGILVNTGMQRTTAAIGLDPVLLDGNLKLNINAKGMYINNNFGNSDAIGSAIGMDPTKPVMNGNQRFGGYYTWTSPDGDATGFGINPVAQAKIPDNKSDVYRTIANIQADYKFPFLPDLRANLNLAIDYAKSTGHNNVDTTASWKRRGVFGQLNDYHAKNTNSLLDFYLNYVKKLDVIASKIDITAGYSWQHIKKEGDSYTRSVNDAKHPYSLYGSTDSTSYAKENFLVSFFGRLNYSIMDRYMLTFTIRDDGSSRFSKDNRWGLFKSGALAWKVREESFLKDVKAVSDLKLRAGWGETGQQDIGDNFYPYQARYTVSKIGYSYQFGNQFYQTLRPEAYDPNIKWESTTTVNAGLDFGFFNDRITGSFDIYKRTTDNLLSNINIPNGSNFKDQLFTNVGSLENKGYEVTLNVRPISQKDMDLTLGFNLTYNQNKITKLLKHDTSSFVGVYDGQVGLNSVIKINSVGYPAHSFWVNKQIYDGNGNPVEGVYANLSGVGGAVSGTDANKYHYKQAAPDYLIGLSARYNYKNFDISASSRISIGNYVYNAVAAQASYDIRYALGYWSNAPKFLNDSKFITREFDSDYFVENASFFKLDNVSAGYNFDKLYNGKIGARVSFTVQNVLTVTKYKGLDPEVDGGIDNNFYPRPRTFILGVNLTF